MDEPMTTRRSAAVRPDAEGAPAGAPEAVALLMLDVAQCFFKVRALGQKAGLITVWGGGAFGMLRSLALLGPLTVPQIAQMRPTSRQRMQRLADELEGEGLVAFVENPRHRRSRLVSLTPRGEHRYRALNARLMALAVPIAATLGEAEVSAASAVLRRLSDELGKSWEGGQEPGLSGHRHTLANVELDDAFER
jgi:DNA-binding MarR family transcriptional regulator